METILKLARQKNIISAADVEEAGVSRNELYKLCKAGSLKRISRGLYALNDYEPGGNIGILNATKKSPKAVVCLLSALQYYELSTQVPHEVWLALPRGSWHPVMEYPPVRVFSLSGEAYSFGIEQHSISGMPVNLYSPAKTIADCFKFRNTVGLDIAIEAMKEAWKSRVVTADSLVEAAKVNKVLKIMRPYLEAIV